MKHSSLALSVKSFAKLNLYLQILNKRKDNFHNLKTLFCRIDLADMLIFRARKDGLIKIKCSSRNVPKDKTNLCWRAAKLLQQEHKLRSNGLPSDWQSHGLNLGVEIEIKKRIPVGAGLGGGSSNAASTLLGLNKYWRLNLSQKKLADLGAKLGSDVPFFVYNTKFALGSGRGDKIRPLTSLNKVKLWFILVYPNFKVSTPLIYRKFDSFSRLTRPRYNVKILTSELLKKGSAIAAAYLFNNLEVVTSSIYPVIDQVKKAFIGIGLEKNIMSGSGSAVFAVCNSLAQSQSLSRKLRKAHKPWQIFTCSAV